MDEAQPAPATARPPRRRPLGVIVTTVGLVLTAASAYLVAATALLEGSVPWTALPLLGETGNVVALDRGARPRRRGGRARAGHRGAGRWRSGSTCSGPGAGPG